jgi:hypothetical protein
MTIRATREAIVARSIGRALLVLTGENPGRHERIGRRVNHPTEMQGEGDQRGSDEPREKRTL